MQKQNFEKREIKHNRLAVCSKCGRVDEKRNLAALYLKADRYSNPKLMCHICHDCLAALAEELELSM